MFLVKTLISFLFFMYSSSFVTTDSEYTVERIIDWKNKFIYFDITKNISSDKDHYDSLVFQPTSKPLYELNDVKDQLIRESLFTLVIDSDSLFKDYFNSNPNIIMSLFGENNMLKRDYMKFSDDLRTVTVRYKISIFPSFINLFYSSEKAYDAFYPVVKTESEQNKYTGIIIYAGNTYSDELNHEQLEDAFFIKIYDLNYKTFFEKRMLHPDALKKWGMLEYTNDINYQNKDRIGESPLRIVARDVVGKYKTDIILDDYSINKIFSDENNINLLKDGKLVIIK